MTTNKPEDLISSTPDAELLSLIKNEKSINYNLSEEEVTQQQRDGVVALNILIAHFKDMQLERLSKVTTAKTLVALKDLKVRDYALGIHDPLYGSDLWSWLLLLAPSGYRAPVACLLALSSYEDGDSTTAKFALDIAKKDNSSYTMTTLLETVIYKNINPLVFQEMRKELHPKVLDQLGLKS